MLRYAAYVTQPGTLPMLGATATTILPDQTRRPTALPPSARSSSSCTPAARAAGRPRALDAVPRLGAVRPAVALASTAELRDQSFVTFDTGAYRTDHSHLDALSVTLYSHGTTRVPEAGLFTYVPGPDFDYFHGTRGHNTVLVDGAHQAQGDATGPPRHGGEAAWASGTSRLYAGVEHRRTVVLLRRGLVLVWDSLSGSSAHRYTASAAGRAGGRGRRTGGGPRGRPAVGGDRPGGGGRDRPRRARDATDPMQGWHSSQYGKGCPPSRWSARARGRARASPPCWGRVPTPRSPPTTQRGGPRGAPADGVRRSG